MNGELDKDQGVCTTPSYRILSNYKEKNIVESLADTTLIKYLELTSAVWGQIKLCST